MTFFFLEFYVFRQFYDNKIMNLNDSEIIRIILLLCGTLVETRAKTI